MNKCDLDELSRDLVHLHFNEYKYFTRLLLALSTGSLTILISFQKDWVNSNSNYSLFAIFSLLILFLSIGIGVALQYSIMIHILDPIRLIQKRGEEILVNPYIYRELEALLHPSLIQKIFYKLQIIFFLTSYLSLFLYIVLIQT